MLDELRVYNTHASSGLDIESCCLAPCLVLKVASPVEMTPLYSPVFMVNI